MVESSCVKIFRKLTICGELFSLFSGSVMLTNIR